MHSKSKDLIHWGWLLLAFSIPLHRSFTIILLLIFVLTILVVGNYSKLTSKKNLIKLSLAFLWIIPFIQLIIYGDLTQNWHKLEIKLSLICFPLILVLSNIDLNKFIYKVLKFYVWGCFFSSILCWAFSFFNFVKTGNKEIFFYTELSLFHHPSYYAMFLSFATAIVGFFIIYPNKEFNFSKKLNGIILPVFILTILCLTSRSGWLVLLLISMLFFILALKHGTISIKQSVMIVLSIVLLAIIGLNQPKVNLRFQEMINHSLFASSQSNYPSSTSTRKKAWEAAISCIKEKPLLGYGTGNGNAKLIEYYKSKNYNNAAEKKINAHNEYLQFSLDHGIIAGLILIFLTIIMSLKTYKTIPLMAIFLAICSVNFLTESIIEKSSGVIFFGYFNTLFYFILIDHIKPDEK
jgi:O-antigen ligase